MLVQRVLWVMRFFVCFCSNVCFLRFYHLRSECKFGEAWLVVDNGGLRGQRVVLIELSAPKRVPC